MKGVLLFFVIAGVALAAFWYFCPVISCESDSRDGEHPALFGVHLRDEIKSERNVPSSFTVTNTLCTCYLSPEICYYGIPSQKIIDGIGPCVVAASGFDGNVIRVQFFKYYKLSTLSEVESDFGILCDYIGKHYDGTSKFTKNKTSWNQEWDLGYGQKITVSYSGPVGRTGGHINVSLQDADRIINDCRAARQRGMNGL